MMADKNQYGRIRLAICGTDAAIATVLGTDPLYNTFSRQKKQTFCSFLAWNAARKGHVVMLKHMCLHGINIKKQFKGRTILWNACTHSHQNNVLKMVEIILAQEDGAATLNIGCGPRKYTPLHLIAHCGWSAIARRMLECDADPTLHAANGKNALDMAKCHRETHLIHKLLKTACFCLRLRVAAIGEWRPRLHHYFMGCTRQELRTLVMLAKTRNSRLDQAEELTARYEYACLCLLPEELLQIVYMDVAYVPV